MKAAIQVKMRLMSPTEEIAAVFGSKYHILSE